MKTGAQGNYSKIFAAILLMAPFGVGASELNPNELDDWHIISATFGPTVNTASNIHIHPVSYSPSQLTAADNEYKSATEKSEPILSIQLDNTRQQGWLITPYAESGKHRSENDIVGLSFTRQW